MAYVGIGLPWTAVVRVPAVLSTANFSSPVQQRSMGLPQQRPLAPVNETDATTSNEFCRVVLELDAAKPMPAIAVPAAEGRQQAAGILAANGASGSRVSEEQAAVRGSGGAGVLRAAASPSEGQSANGSLPAGRYQAQHSTSFTTQHDSAAFGSTAPPCRGSQSQQVNNQQLLPPAATGSTSGTTRGSSEGPLPQEPTSTGVLCSTGAPERTSLDGSLYVSGAPTWVFSILDSLLLV